MDDEKINEMVQTEVDRRLDQKEIDYIISQTKKLAVILGIVGVLLIVLGIISFTYVTGGIIYGIIGLTYLVLAILLITQKTKTMMLIAGLCCIILGFFLALIPLLIGIALLYYYNKLNKLLKKENDDNLNN